MRRRMLQLLLIGDVILIGNLRKINEFSFARESNILELERVQISASLPLFCKRSEVRIAASSVPAFSADGIIEII